jgi:hypothetical protein
VRHSVVIGHQLEVYPSEEGWGVVVDGEEGRARFGSAYSAWAAGTAESYRQGRLADVRPAQD